MRVLHLSDWHCDAEGFKENLAREVRENPEMGNPNLIALTGDMVFNTYAWRGNPALEGQYQRDAFAQMCDFLYDCFPGVDVIGVRGNHDFFNYDVVGDSWAGSQAFVLGGLKFASLRGVPLHTGSWNDEYSEGELAEFAKQVPWDTQVLITHAPPFGILDDTHDVPSVEQLATLQNPGDFPVIEPRNIGSQAFRDLVDRLPNLKLHMFGHVHEQGCKVEVRKNVIYSNASCGANLILL